MTRQILVKLTFTAERQAESSWKEWAAHNWCDGAFDFYVVAHWLSADRSVVFFVIEDEPYARRRLLAFQGDKEDIASIHIDEEVLN